MAFVKGRHGGTFGAPQATGHGQQDSVGMTSTQRGRVLETLREKPLSWMECGVANEQLKSAFGIGRGDSNKL